MVSIDLRETPIEKCILEAETLPFLSERRLIIGHHAEFLVGGKSNLNHQVDRLIDYLQHPVETSVLILTNPADKLDKRKKVVKALQKRAKTVQFSPLTGTQLLKWLQKRVRHYQIQADEQSLRQLAILVGNDLRQLDQECKKIATYLGVGGHMRTEVVNELVPRTLEQDVFKLINQLAARKVDQAFQIWYDLLHQREEPIRILALIIRQLRLMYYTQLLYQKGKTEKEIATLLKSHPYPVKLARKQSELFQHQELQKYLARAIQIDQEIKSGKCDKVIAIEQFLFAW